jgi:hypothetical protein
MRSNNPSGKLDRLRLRLGRNRGALPRFRRRWRCGVEPGSWECYGGQGRGPGEQSGIVTHALPFPTLCIALTEDEERDTILQARGVRVSVLASQSVDDRAQHGPGRSAQKFLCSPRPRPCRAIAKRRRKRGSAPPLRIHAAFSLVEVLASLFVLTISAMGITAAWRLADYQELLTRVDRRAERILRQYYELQTFAPPESRPFTVNASSSPSTQNTITGYLYHPRLIAGQNGSNPFGDLIPFSISMTNGAAPGGNQLVLTYTVPSYGTQASRQVTKTVVLNLLNL